MDTRKRKAKNNYLPRLAPALRQQKQDNFQMNNSLNNNTFVSADIEEINNYLPRDALALRPQKQDNFQMNTRRAEIEEINKGHRRSRSIVTFEAQESFEWPINTYYMSFLIDFKQRNGDLVKRLDDALIEGGYEITSNFFDSVKEWYEKDNKYITRRFKNIIKLSYAIDLIHHATDKPEVVYKVLKTVALMSVDAADNLTLRDCYYLFDAADTIALWADILRTHGAFVVSKIKAHQMAQEAYTQELLCQAQSQDFTFQPPSEIIINKIAYFLFIKNGKRTLPELTETAETADTEDYVNLFIIQLMKKVLKIKPTVSALVIYKILKTVTSMNVKINAKTGNTLQFSKHSAEIGVLLPQPVKADLITLLLQKKANHLARMASLVTKRFGPEGPDSIEMLFLCADEKCAPVRRTDQLLSFLKQQMYTQSYFLNIVFTPSHI